MRGWECGRSPDAARLATNTRPFHGRRTERQPQLAAFLGRREEDCGLSRDVLHELDSPERSEPGVGQYVGKPAGVADVLAIKALPDRAEEEEFDPHRRKHEGHAQYHAGSADHPVQVFFVWYEPRGLPSHGLNAHAAIAAATGDHLQDDQYKPCDRDADDG